MKKLYIFILSIILSLSAFCGCAKTVEPESSDGLYKGVNLNKIIDYVVKDGVSDYVIIKASDCSETISYAAEELSYFINKSTGIVIDVETDTSLTFSDTKKYISLGNNKVYEQSGISFDYRTLNYDGFIIKTVGKSIFINGYYDRGVLYGVYDFLEKFLGIKFLSYDDTFVPVNNQLTVYEMDIVEIPSFSMRTFLDGTVYGGFADLPFYARSRTNNSFVVASEKYGGSANMYGRNNDHNYHCYVPREIYYNDHPEFYYYSAEYDIGGDNGWTIDLLNGITDDGKLDESMEISVAKIVIEEMKKDILEKPDVDFFVFEQEDGPFCYEYKPGSKQQAIVDKYGRSGIMVRFCNVLSSELQKWADAELGGRKINIITFAYSYTKYPPIKEINGKIVPIDETVIANDNLVIRMALAGNRYYSYFNEKSETKELIEGWSAVANNFMFWGYDADFVEYLWYMPFISQISENVKGFNSMNISYMLNQGCWNTRTNWMSTMKTYIYSKLFWNMNRNIYEILEEYLTLYYEDAAPYVKSMIFLFEEHFARQFAANEDLKINVTGSSEYKQAKYYSIEMLEKALNLMYQAEDAIRKNVSSPKKQEELLKKIARVKVTPMRMIMRYYQYFYPLANQRDENDFVKEFFEACDYGGVDMFNELQSISDLKYSYNML